MKVKKCYKATQEARKLIHNLFQQQEKMEEMTRAMKALSTLEKDIKEQEKIRVTKGMKMSAEKWEEWEGEWEAAYQDR